MSTLADSRLNGGDSEEYVEGGFASWDSRNAGAALATQALLHTPVLFAVLHEPIWFMSLTHEGEGMRMDKMEAKRRKDFLAELAQVGNISLAAERAKVSRAWALHRKRDDPAFREQAEAAMRVAHERLKEAESSGPTGRWRAQDGHELVIQHGHGRFVQVRRARRKQWTPRTEARFLAALAVSCNVRAAVRAAETTPKSAYRHRERWPDFAQRWDQALEEGYDRLSTLIVANGCKMLGDEQVAPEVELTGMTFDSALQTLQLYRRQIHGDGKEGRKRGWWRRTRTLDEVRGSIFTKLECIVRANEEEVVAIMAAKAQEEERRDGPIQKGRGDIC